MTKGDRVEMTDEARRQFAARKGAATTGTVVGPSKTPGCVAVLLDGKKNYGVYHRSFWRVVKAPAARKGA